MSLQDACDRLAKLAEEPPRGAMPRSEFFPSMAAQHIRNEEEKVALRKGLREALGIIDGLRSQLREPPRDGGDL